MTPGKLFILSYTDLGDSCSNRGIYGITVILWEKNSEDKRHTFKVLSSEAVTRNWPSLEKSTLLTVAVWALKTVLSPFLKFVCNSQNKYHSQKNTQQGKHGIQQSGGLNKELNVNSCITFSTPCQRMLNINGGLVWRNACVTAHLKLKGLYIFIHVNQCHFVSRHWCEKYTAVEQTGNFKLARLLTHLEPKVWQFCLEMQKQWGVQMVKIWHRGQHPMQVKKLCYLTTWTSFTNEKPNQDPKYCS